MDYIHASRLVGAPIVTLSLVKANTHVIVHGRLDRFAALLVELQSAMPAPWKIERG